MWSFCWRSFAVVGFLHVKCSWLINNFKSLRTKYCGGDNDWTVILGWLVDTWWAESSSRDSVTAVERVTLWPGRAVTRDGSYYNGRLSQQQCCCTLLPLTDTLHRTHGPGKNNSATIQSVTSDVGKVCTCKMTEVRLICIQIFNSFCYCCSPFHFEIEFPDCKND